MTFTEVLDCWDREASDYERDGPTIQLGGEEYFLVYEFALNKDILDSTPLEKRLLFKMGGVLSAYITAHQSVLAKIFGEQGKNGAEYIRVSDYGK